jgi:hypothetical protein
MVGRLLFEPKRCVTMGATRMALMPSDWALGRRDTIEALPGQDIEGADCDGGYGTMEGLTRITVNDQWLDCKDS